MNDLSIINSLAESEELIKEEKQHFLKKLNWFAKSVYFDSDLYCNYPTYTWVDEDDNGDIKIKFNIDDSINNFFSIKHNTETYLNGFKTLQDIVSSDDEHKLKFKNNLNKIIKKNLTSFELKYRVSNIYFDKSKVIFYLKRL